MRTIADPNRDRSLRRGDRGRTALLRGLTVLAVLAVSALVAGLLVSPAPATVVEQRLTAPDVATSRQFGWSMARDGDTLVIGTPYRDGARGAVYVFTRSGASWTYAATLTASDGVNDDWLGWSVAIDGDTIVAGAPGDDIGMTSNQGSVYTFTRAGADPRHESAKLTVSGGASEWLGGSVAVDGDVIVAGANWTDVGGQVDQGAAYTFTTSGASTRTETATLTASDGNANDWFGYSVAVDGDLIVVGAESADVGGALGRGAVYTFDRTGPAARTETAKLTASDGTGGDALGYSLALEGDTIVAGAAFDDVNGHHGQGSAYTFARTGASARTQTAKLTASDGAESDWFGKSVAIDASRIVVGAPWDDVNGNNAQGSAYTFARTGPASRTETARYSASDGLEADSLGYSVALDGDALLAGAPYDDVVNPFQGSVSIFRGSPDPTPPPGTTPRDTTAPDTLNLKGPKKVRQGKAAVFTFASSEAGSTFMCQVDKKAYKNCASPYKVKTRKFGLGKHTLRVVAVDAAGNHDASPAKRKFKVVERKQ